MLRLTRKLLQGIANVLTRYVHSIEKFLAREDLPAQHPLSGYSDEHPPAHWLAKVRQGAPQLLDHHAGGETETVVHSPETKRAAGFHPPVSSDANEKPPVHWIKRIQYDVLHLLDAQPDDKKNTPAHSASEVQLKPQPPIDQTGTAIDANQETIPVTQARASTTRPQIDREWSDNRLSGQAFEKTSPDSLDNTEGRGHRTEIQRDEMLLDALTGSTKERNKTTANPPHLSEKKTARNNTAWEQTDPVQPVKPSIKRSETESVALSRTLRRTLQLSTPIPGISAQDKKNRQPISPAHEPFAATHRVQITPHPHETRATPQRFPDSAAEPRGAVDTTARISQGFNETTVLNADKTPRFPYACQPQQNVNRQSAVRRSSNTADPAATAIAAGLNQKQYTAPAFTGDESFESDFPHWPSLPGEQERRLHGDRWPELPALPEESMPKPDKTVQPIHLAQLQAAIRRQHHNELEHRGLSWNG